MRNFAESRRTNKATNEQMDESRSDELSQLATQDLLDRALVEARRDLSGESNERWECISALHGRHADDEVFETASAWCSDESPIERQLGTEVLAQLGHLPEAEYSPFGQQSLSIFLELLDDPEPAVVKSAIIGLGHLICWEVDFDPSCLNTLAESDDPTIRYAVAFSLGGDPCSRGPAGGGDVCVGLLSDPDSDVRKLGRLRPRCHQQRRLGRGPVRSR